MPIFVKFNDQKLLFGNPSLEKCAQISYDLVFVKEFELSRSSKNVTVYFCGCNKAVVHDAFGYPFVCISFVWEVLCSIILSVIV